MNLGGFMRNFGSCPLGVEFHWVLVVATLIFSVPAGTVGSNDSTVFTLGTEYQGRHLSWSSDFDVLNLHSELNMTCDGGFNAKPVTSTNSGTNLLTDSMDLSLSNNPGYQSGGCFYKNPVDLSGTSFSTMFGIASTTGYVAPKPCVSSCTDPQQSIAFIVTGDVSGYYSDNFSVELDFYNDFYFRQSFEQSYTGMVRIKINSTQVLWASIDGLSHYGVLYNGSFTELLSTEFFVWIEFESSTQILNLTLSTDDLLVKPSPVYSSKINLPPFRETMFVGFSGKFLSDKGQQITINTWNFNSNGPAPDLLRDSNGTAIVMPDVGKEGQGRRRMHFAWRLIPIIGVPAGVVLLSLIYVTSVLYMRNSRLTALAKKYRIEELELLSQGAQSYSYKTLNVATKGFSSNHLLGKGGFGSVYRGRLRLVGAKNLTDVAVKQISKTSGQGVREFLAEVKIIGQVQHRNLVRVLGWCHERGELLLVYDFMPNGSLDQHLFMNSDESIGGGNESDPLTWARRLKIVSGVAMALAYLHEEWEQRVIHRDVKSSNVMLDADFNARLGDFGLARLSDHNQAPPSTAVLAGTRGYLAPELGHTLKATEKTDVYSFGVMVLEVGTGKRPLLPLQDRRTPDEVLLVDWVWSLYGKGSLLDAVDSRLESAYHSGEMATLLKIGLLCCHPDPDGRPTMREVINIWKGSNPFPPLPDTKPVPVFIRDYANTTIGMNSDVSVDSDHNPLIYNPVMGPYAPVVKPSPGERLPAISEVMLMHTSSFRSSGNLRSRLWKSTPLPM